MNENISTENTSKDFMKRVRSLGQGIESKATEVRKALSKAEDEFELHEWRPDAVLSFTHCPVDVGPCQVGAAKSGRASFHQSICVFGHSSRLRPPLPSSSISSNILSS